MSYCTRGDIELRYGATTVNLWADLEGDGSLEDARINKAIAIADARIDDTLRVSASEFKLPIADDDDLVPASINDISIKLAGYWLSTARGVRDYDDKGTPMTRLWGDYQDALMTLDLIAKGIISPEGTA